MNREIIDKIIDFFEAVKVRPLIYFGKYDTSVTNVFTDGFYMALIITNLTFPSLEIRQISAKNRGWNFNALGICSSYERERFV